MRRLRSFRSTTIAWCLVMALVLSWGSSAVQAISHNATSKWGATFYYWLWYDGSIPSTTFFPPSFSSWNVNDQAWWNEMVAQAKNAGLGWLAANSWGPGLDADPVRLWRLVDAINANGGGIKVALYDDTTSEVLRKNAARGRGYVRPGDNAPPDDPLRFDLQDSNGTGEGGWFYFYDQQWKPYFQTIPDQHRFKVNGRPVVFMWHGGAEWYRNHAYFSNMIAALRQACLNDFGFDPYIIVEESWLGLDGDVNVDATHDWFDNGKYLTTTNHNGVIVRHTIPGYNSTAFNDGRPTWWVARSSSGTHDPNFYYSNLQNAWGSDLVLIEGLNNAEENPHLIPTPAWGNQYIEITRTWATTYP